MWITQFMAKNIKENPAVTAGSVTNSYGSQMEVEASSKHRDVPVVAPYGVVCVPPAGEQAVMVHTPLGDACVGVVHSEEYSLEPGEIMLRSLGGATLILRNDGKVYVNGKELGGA